ncbi:MAG: hypothetical protein K8R57_10290 [Verrucomicrobia bacterium]|nr:hypothetical protein [Verrucomicrobiota bacterium]
MICLFIAAISTLRAGTFDPLTVTLQPKLTIGSIPVWETGTNNVPSIHPESDSVDIPVPSLSSQEEIGCFALTVVFQDNGDGGPVVEWRSNQGDLTLLSAGLGETGVALGLNARTLLLPQSLTLDGGTVRVSFAGRFSRLILFSLRPARELGVAALGEDFKPALIENDHQVLTEEEVSGGDHRPQSGDRTDGYVIHADLAASPLRLDLSGSGNTTEFVVPLSGKPAGSLLQAEVGGLDPESWIEVSINGELRGILAPVPFSLTSPGIIISPDGRLQVAGWRSASIFIPSRLWTSGDNSIVLLLHRAPGDSGAPVYLRNVRTDLLFPSVSTPLPATTAAPVNATSSSAGTSAAPLSTASRSPETLSTGSLYGNPSPSLFHASSPAPLPTGGPP